MNTIGDYQLLNSSLLIAVVLFVLGITGFIARRNVIVMFLSAGVMLQGVTLALCAFSSFHGNWSGRIAALFLLMTTVVVGSVVLAIVVVFVQQKRSLDVAGWQRLGRSQQPNEQFHGSKKPGILEKPGFLNADSGQQVADEKPNGGESDA